MYAASPSLQSQPKPRRPRGEGAEECLAKEERPAPLPPQLQGSEPPFGASLSFPKQGRQSVSNFADQYAVQGADGYSQQQNDNQRGVHASSQRNWQGYAEPRSPVSPLDSYPSTAAQFPSAKYPHNPQYQQSQVAASFPIQQEARQSSYPNESQLQPQGNTRTPQSSQDRKYYNGVPQQSKSKPPEDLLTSPFETAIPAIVTNVVPPPIPPNPQKDALLSAISRTITKQIQSTHASNASAISPLLAQQAALTSTLDAVSLETSQLNDLEALLSSNEAILHQAMRDADKVLEDAKKRKVPHVDDVLVAPTVVAGQLYQAVAEERAIEDCRGALGKALDRGKIGGVVWAKVRRFHTTQSLKEIY